jgi:hypothetical protein
LINYSCVHRSLRCAKNPIALEQTMRPINTMSLFAIFFVAASAYSMPTNSSFGYFSHGLSSTGAAPVLQASKKANKTHKAKKRGGGKIKFDPGSGETRKERDTRLLRECKGRPNSGACLGYAS